MSDDIHADVEVEREGVDDTRLLALLANDPNAVHINLLRGSLARPSVEQIVHVYGRAALEAALQSTPLAPASKAEPVAWVNPETLDRLKERRRFTTALLHPAREDNDDATAPLYLHPNIEGATGFAEGVTPWGSPIMGEARISEEGLKAILDGCEGVTPGPWMTVAGANSHVFDLRVVRNLPDEPLVAFCDGYDAAHIARLDPNTVRSIITELLELREKARG